MKNSIVIDAQVISEPVKKGKSYRAVAACKRSSGVLDNFNLVTQKELHKGQFIRITGHISVLLSKDRKLIRSCSVCGDKIEVLDSEPVNYENKIVLKGCMVEGDIQFRKSYDGTGRDIATYILNIGDSGMLHATSWESTARFLAKYVSNTDKLHVEGRLQGYTSKVSGILYFSIVTYLLEFLDKEK